MFIHIIYETTSQVTVSQHISWQLQSADVPFSHRPPVNPPGHWHWNAPGTLIHVPLFWHGLLVLLAHSSMSEKKHNLGHFLLGFHSVFWKSYLLRSIFLKEPLFPDTPNNWASRRTISDKIWPASNFEFQSDLQSHTADDMCGDR